MADDIYTREELEGMTRLQLRRTCKDLGMAAEECSRMHYDHLVDWILDNQEGGEAQEKPAASKKKTSTKKAAATKKTGGGKAALAAKKTGTKKTTSTKKKTTARKPAPEPDPEPEHDEDGVVDAGAMDVIVNIEGKIDELGKVYSANSEEIGEKLEALSEKLDAVVDDNFRLQCELYKTQGVLVHMASWLEAAGILDPDEAPEGMSIEEKLNALAAEVEGNDEGEDDE